MLAVEAPGKPDKKSDLIKAELEKLLKKHGRLTTEIVVKAATPKNHGEFDWDESVAAHRWRLEQAYHLIMAQRMVVNLEQRRKETPRACAVPAFPATGERNGTHLDRSTILQDPGHRAALVNAKLGMLRAWCNSVVDISELSELRVLIESKIEN
jgi:hypothetical protein